MRQLKHLEMNGQTGRASIVQQGRAIDELENRLEKRHVKKCDPSIPLHLLATYTARSAISSMRLSVHHAQQYLDKGAELYQSEKDMLLTLGLHVIVVDNHVYSTKSLEGYLWHVAVSFAFEAFILVLTQIITRDEGKVVDRAWMPVHHVFESYPGLITDTRNPLYFATGKQEGEGGSAATVSARGASVYLQATYPKKTQIITSHSESVPRRNRAIITS